MKFDFRTLLLLACGLLVLFGAVAAEAQDRTFVGDDGDSWGLNDSWDPPFVPTADHDVLIPNNANHRICVIPEDYDTAACKSLTIEEGAEVQMEDDAVLTLGENDGPNTSTIEGLLALGEEGDPLSEATLIIGDDHTMLGGGLSPSR